MQERRRHDTTSDTAAERRPTYEPPTVTTYTDDELLEALGPAQTQGYGGPDPN